MGESKILPHGALTPLATNLWQVTGSLPFPLPRNMTVYRTGDGRLVLHSVVAMDEAGMRALEALGTPAIMVVPHSQHAMDAPFYKERYPALTVVCPESERGKVSKRVPVDGTIDEVLTPLGIECRPIPKHKFGEHVLIAPVDGGKALICNDLLGNGEGRSGGGFGGFVMRVFGVPGGGFGVPRIVGWVALRSKAAARAFIEELATVPDLRAVVISHGNPVLSNPAAALKVAAERL